MRISLMLVGLAAAVMFFLSSIPATANDEESKVSSSSTGLADHVKIECWTTPGAYHIKIIYHAEGKRVLRIRLHTKGGHSVLYLSKAVPGGNHTINRKLGKSAYRDPLLRACATLWKGSHQTSSDCDPF